MVHVLYLVHDIADPAVRRRISMLRTGGATVTLAGFRRTEQPVFDIDGVKPIDLGKTHDGRFAQRIASVAKVAFSARTAFGSVPRPDVIIARNLEMLAIARRANTVFSDAAPIVYECLDIHRLLLRDDFVGRALRWVERALGRDIKLLLTSSPAFIRQYFEPFGQIAAPVELVENKYYEAVAVGGNPEPTPLPAGPPWRIGWFGALRCRRSLELLAAFSRRMEGRFEIVLRGRPALSEFPDFHGFVEAEPYMSFEGSYRNPEDMVRIYGDVHFSWAIDFFEEGQNSKWLLPNRLYEGCRFGAVPIAMADTETARFLARQQIGVILSEAAPSALVGAIWDMNEERFSSLQKQVASCNPATWTYDRSDCRLLVAKLGRVSGISPGLALEGAPG